MEYDTELKFTEKLLENLRLNLDYIDSGSSGGFAPLPDRELRRILNYDLDKDTLLTLLHTHCRPNTIYHIQDAFLCHYLLFALPGTQNPCYAYVGPYALELASKQDIYNIADKYRIPPENVRQLEHFYQELPLLSDENMLLAIIYTLGEQLWGDIDGFSTYKLNHLFTASSSSILIQPEILEPEEALISMKLLEERYATEHRLIQAVSAGQVHKAELAFMSLSSRQLEQRTSNSLRNLKNYAIILNTVLRIAAESGAVHPLHIDSISSLYARKIEMTASESSLSHLMKEMVRRYALLVKNHSLKGYSLLVRKVITRIDADLTADLSLKTQAKLLNVNPSYLSTLFKKETGSTLTEYVNRKRMEHALFLLNSTDMQIQMIALHCGIPDVNYFTKIFKKMIGKTPKEYRETLNSHFQ